jgi:hypothetical protein
VRDAGGNRDRLARTDDEILVADEEAQSPVEHRRDLLVRMRVAGYDRASREVDARDREMLGMQHLPSDALGELLDRLV